MTKKILAMLLALALVLSFAACDGKTEEETTTLEDTSITDVTDESTEATEPEDTTDETESTEGTEATEVTQVTEVTETTTAKVSDPSTEKPSETEKETPKMPKDKAAIVKQFNDSVNSVKKTAKSGTRKYSKITINGTLTLPSAVNGILKILGGADKFVGGQLEKNSKMTPETFSGAELNRVYPVENESYASKLTAADVKSATCVEKDGKWIITIETISDSKTDNVQHGQGHAPKAFNVILPATVNDNIPGVAESLIGLSTMEYPSCKAIVTIDPETGNVITAEYILNWTINFDKVGAILPFTTHDFWEIKY